MDFLGRTEKRKLKLKDRIRTILEIVNRDGHVTVSELSNLWTLQPSYVRMMMRMAASQNSYLMFEEDLDMLLIPERAKAAEGTPGTSKEEEVKG